jgi:hypothetical protein
MAVNAYRPSPTGQMRVDISVNDNGLLAMLDGFPKQKNVAISRGINRTSAWTKTRMTKIAKQELTVNRVGDIGRSLTATRATPEKLRATVKVGGKRIALYHFKGKPTQPPKNRPKGGISYQIRAEGGRQRIEKNAFVARINGLPSFFRRSSSNIGHEKVIAKTGKRAGKWIWSQRKIIKLMGISVVTAVEGSSEFKKLITVEAGERLQLELDRAASFILTGTSKVGGGDA